LAQGRAISRTPYLQRMLDYIHRASLWYIYVYWFASRLNIHGVEALEMTYAVSREVPIHIAGPYAQGYYFEARVHAWLNIRQV